jgi:hypothetical protein
MMSLSMCAGGDRELIGVDDVRTPYWASVDGMVAVASMLQVAKSIPRVLVFITRRAWRASVGLTALGLAAQLMSGVATAFGLLAATDVFFGLLEQGPSPQRIAAALPAMNARDADVVVMLENDKVIEHGTHDQLMAKRSSYFDLFTVQSRSNENLDGTPPSCCEEGGVAVVAVQ